MLKDGRLKTTPRSSHKVYYVNKFPLEKMPGENITNALSPCYLSLAKVSTDISISSYNPDLRHGLEFDCN